MNTINNPLKIEIDFIGTGLDRTVKSEYYYTCNKPGYAVGEYVDKKLAVEMLEALKEYLLEMTGFESSKSLKIKELILKAKGQ